jgi:TRAP transporter TAXI family solute receptor
MPLSIRFAAVIALGAAALGFSASQALSQAKKPDIRIATGTPGGAYYAMGAVFADALTRSGKVNTATAEASSGAIESSRLMVSGEVTLGGMDANWVVAGLKGEAPYKEKIPLVTVVPLGVWGLFFIGLESSNIVSLDQIKGKRVAVGAKGSGMEAHARQILTSIGLTIDDIRPVYQAFGPGATSVREGKADLQLQCCIPNPGLTELSELSKTRVVATPPQMLDKIIETSGVYAHGALKKGAIRGHDVDLPVVNILNGWMGVASLPEETAYLIARTMIENINGMAEKSPQYETVKELFESAKTSGSKALEMGAPLHPGSLRAFKEAGILK